MHKAIALLYRYLVECATLPPAVLNGVMFEQLMLLRTMKDEVLLHQIREVNQLRAAIDATGPTFTSAQVKTDVTKIYGRSVHHKTWQRWRLKCGITPELLMEYGGDYPAGAYLLLMVNAKLSRGNGPKERSRKVTRPMLVAAVKAHRRRSFASATQQLPECLSYVELKQTAEAQANRTYHRRTHEKNGILRRKQRYSRAEALEILSQYPTFALGA